LLPAPTAPSEGYAGVRSTWSRPVKRLGPRFSILAHQLRRRFPPNRSLLRGARSIYSTARPEGSLVFRPFWPGFWNRSPSKPKPSSVLRPFLGRSLLRPASLTDDPKITRSRVALEEDRLFRRLFPAGPRRTRRLFPFLPAEIGPLVTCRALLAVAGPPGEAGTAVPITCLQCTCPPSRESENFAFRPVDNGDIGHNCRNLSGFAESAQPRLPFRSPPPTSAKCLNRLPWLPIRLTCRASIRRSVRPCSRLKVRFSSSPAPAPGRRPR
jgi:hypothetical protein